MAPRKPIATSAEHERARRPRGSRPSVAREGDSHTELAREQLEQLLFAAARRRAEAVKSR